MRTLTEKYNGVLKGLFSKDQFLRDARMEQSQLITQHNSYNDAVNILLNKGLISESMSDQGKGKIIKSATQNGDKSYSVTYEDGTTAKIAVSHDDWDGIHSKYGSLSEEEVVEGMTPEEWADAKEQERLQAHPERKGIEDVRAMLDKERSKPMKFDDPKLDQEYQEWLATTDYDGPLEEQEVSLEEGPAKNNPKIEKLVAGINDLISQAVDSDGDPVGVIEPGTTWEEPYVYSPIEYKNGQLKITSRSLYKDTPEVDMILARNMEFDGIPTLRLIMRMYKKAIKQAGRMSSQDTEMEEGLSPYGDDAYIKSVEEKKLTPVEKKGKEKIVKGLKKSGMSKDDPMTYAIATAKAKELYEGPAEVDTAYYDVIAKIAEHARKLNDDDAYQFHEQLKSFFNRMLEEGADGKLKVGDVIDHKGEKKKIVRIVGNKISLQPVGSTGGDIEIDRQLGVKNSLMEAEEIEEQDIHLAKQIARAISREDGVTKYVVEREKMVITYVVADQPEAGNTIAGYKNGAPIAGLNEAKDKYTEIESPKPELPLDVLHHGIRFELDKKEIGNTPTEEEYMKAFKAATKNLEKDLLYYKKEEGATEAPVSKKEEMVKMKLKESFKTIIRNILSENTSSKKSFNIKGEVL